MGHSGDKPLVDTALDAVGANGRDGAGGAATIRSAKPLSVHSYLAMSDFIAPKASGVADYLGMFAVSAGFGLDALIAKYEADHDDYKKIMAESVADRLAEALAEIVHLDVRTTHWGYAKVRDHRCSRHPRAALAANRWRAGGSTSAGSIHRRASGLSRLCTLVAGRGARRARPPAREVPGDPPGTGVPVAARPHGEVDDVEADPRRGDLRHFAHRVPRDAPRCFRLRSRRVARSPACWLALCPTAPHFAYAEPYCRSGARCASHTRAGAAEGGPSARHAPRAERSVHTSRHAVARGGTDTCVCVRFLPWGTSGAGPARLSVLGGGRPLHGRVSRTPARDRAASLCVAWVWHAAGLYFANKCSSYFAVGQIGKDQIDSYAARKRMSVPEVERWLAPILAYDPVA